MLQDCRSYTLVVKNFWVALYRGDRTWQWRKPPSRVLHQGKYHCASINRSYFALTETRMYGSLELGGIVAIHAAMDNKAAEWRQPHPTGAKVTEGSSKINPCIFGSIKEVRLPEGKDCLQALKKRGVEFSFLAPQHMACQDAIARIGKAFVAAQVCPQRSNAWRLHLPLWLAVINTCHMHAWLGPSRQYLLFAAPSS